MFVPLSQARVLFNNYVLNYIGFGPGLEQSSRQLGGKHFLFTTSRVCEVAISFAGQSLDNDFRENFEVGSSSLRLVGTSRKLMHGHSSVRTWEGRLFV